MGKIRATVGHYNSIIHSTNTIYYVRHCARQQTYKIREIVPILRGF